MVGSGSARAGIARLVAFFHSFLLLRRDDAVDLSPLLLSNLADFRCSLLGSERGIGTHSFDLRVSILRHDAALVERSLRYSRDLIARYLFRRWGRMNGLAGNLGRMWQRKTYLRAKCQCGRKKD
jgi:hypothetical protein